MTNMTDAGAGGMELTHRQKVALQLLQTIHNWVNAPNKEEANETEIACFDRYLRRYVRTIILDEESVTAEAAKIEPPLSTAPTLQGEVGEKCTMCGTEMESTMFGPVPKGMKDLARRENDALLKVDQLEKALSQSQSECAGLSRENASMREHIKLHAGDTLSLDNEATMFKERAEEAESECAVLRKALKEISRQYENQDLKHVDFRIGAKEIADEALRNARAAMGGGNG